MAIVYAWPPVWSSPSEWSEEAPIATSRAWPSGRRFASSAGPARRVCSLSVRAPGCGRSGAGYMEALKRLLDGGMHLIRLNSTRINRGTPMPDRDRQWRMIEWQRASGRTFDWERASGRELVWVRGRAPMGELGTAGGQPILDVTGLPPGARVAWPGEFVTVTNAAGVGSTVMIAGRSRANDAGEARLRLVEAPAWSGRVDIGVSETAVFEALGLPRSAKPHAGEWSYDWSFREVFADEVAGGFQEVDPW